MNFCNQLLNSIIHETTSFHRNPLPITSSSPAMTAVNIPENDQNLAVEGGRKKKRRKKPRADAEAQRVTHIAVERNRRKQMNHHLAVLRSLLPESYIQRGDQASIVGGAIEFVKELEHHLQSLEAQKFLLTQQQNQSATILEHNSNFSTKECEIPKVPLYFHKLFSNPQYTWSQVPNKNTSNSKQTLADIEVNLVQTHASLQILSRKRLTHLSKFISFLQSCNLSILHLNIITLDPLVLYSISLKVEEECWLNSADEIAAAVHHMLGLIEEEPTLCFHSKNL
ncbi:putative transcription factor bHLH family [Helianthus annuus]|nr:putative transcription factor bHLH family [Helianthus annuus]